MLHQNTQPLIVLAIVISFPYSHAHYESSFVNEKNGTNYDSRKTKVQDEHDIRNKGKFMCHSDASVKPIRELSAIVGRYRGIQGNNNSSYIDATILAIFAFTR